MFNEELQGICQILKHNQTFICGDFNIDLFKCESHQTSQDNPLIKLPTRINGNLSTLIDNIYTNIIDIDTKNAIIIIINYISDHLPVFIFVKYSTYKINSSNKLPTYINVRLLKAFNIEMLLNRLRDLDWTEVTNCDVINTAYSTLYCIFTKIFNISSLFG